ncbi:MAG: hypothetical protein AAF791_05260 [Bacteroidota bacterium]
MYQSTRLGAGEQGRWVWGWGALGIAGVVLSMQMLTLPALYLVDLSAWVFQGARLRAELADPAGTPGALVSHPVPNTLATLIPAAWLSIAGPVTVGKIMAVGLLLSGLMAGGAVGASVDGREGWARASVIVSCLVVSSSFWNGYLGFQMGVILALLLASVWVHRGEVPPWLVGVGSVALFLAHAVPFGVVALLLGLDALRRRDGWTLAALTPSGVLTVWYVGARVLGTGPEPLATVEAEGIGRHLLHKAYSALKLGPFQHPDGLDGAGVLSGFPGVYWAAVAASVAFVAVLGVALVAGTVRMVRGEHRRAALAAWAIGASALILPPVVLSVVNPGERVMVVAACVLLAVVPVPKRLMSSLGVLALVFLLTDAFALEAQRPGLTPEEIEAAYTDRARREVQPDPPVRLDGAVEDSATPFFGHPVLLHSDRYLAAERADWGRRSFETGLLWSPSAGSSESPASGADSLQAQPRDP